MKQALDFRAVEGRNGLIETRTPEEVLYETEEDV